MPELDARNVTEAGGITTFSILLLMTEYVGGDKWRIAFSADYQIGEGWSSICWADKPLTLSALMEIMNITGTEYIQLAKDGKVVTHAKANELFMWSVAMDHFASKSPQPATALRDFQG